MKDGFDLKTASKEIQDAASLRGIKSGRWEPVNTGRRIETLPSDAVVARVWNSRNDVQIMAYDVK